MSRVADLKPDLSDAAPFDRARPPLPSLPKRCAAVVLHASVDRGVQAVSAKNDYRLMMKSKSMNLMIVHDAHQQGDSVQRLKDIQYTGKFLSILVL